MSDNPAEMPAAVGGFEVGNRGPSDDGPLADVGEALAAFARGEILVVVDDEDRENEGDLIMAAEHVTPEKIGHHMEHLRAGLAARATPAADFRVGNFWAWHIKADREKSLYEARRELVFRGELLPPKYDMEPYVTAEERQLVIDKWQNFAKAFWTRSGKIDDVPESIVNRLIAACSSAGDLGDIDHQLERFRVFEKAGLTELSIRLFDEPMAGLDIVAKHVLPHFERYTP